MKQTAIAGGDAPIRGSDNARYIGKRYRISDHFRGFKLIDSGEQNRKRVERRAHKRLQAPKNAFAIVRSKRTHPIPVKAMSMGEIALAVIKSDPLKLGRIKDLSMNGLAFCYLDNGKTGTDESFKLDILLPKQSEDNRWPQISK